MNTARVEPPLPRIVFVLGKGGTGRSSVAAALGLHFASRGEDTLVVGWTLCDPIAPWFDLPPAGHEAVPLAPHLRVMNFSFDATLREYVVGHLGLRFLHDRVLRSGHVQRLVKAVPGIEELQFCGRLFWLTSLAEDELDEVPERIVVDCPAFGHGASLLESARAASDLGLGGLLAVEVDRVCAMFADPAWTGALLVALPEELSLDETLEFVPVVERHLGRPPLAIVQNRSVARDVPARGPDPEWLGALREGALAPLALLWDELRARARREEWLRKDGAHGLPVLSLREGLLLRPGESARETVTRLAEELGAALGDAGAAGVAPHRARKHKAVRG